ncbi:MAG TPA: LysR substrate-binding domain-containing protein [Terriglobales bacterium]|nr:LysR substrate-binding domain-containing protein [Terriglobales bacterium]
MENFRLKVLRSVARHLNFRRAAEELFLTQPAVTMQIKALEQDLGVQLFDRSGSRISLTPAGAQLVKYAERIYRLETEAQAELARFSGQQRGELRIGASLTIAQYILPRVLGAFQREHPHIQPSMITCNTENVLEKLVAGRIDLGLIEGPTMRRDISTEVFLQDEIVLIIPPAHEWSERSFVEPQDLKRERLLMRELGSGTRRVIEAALQKRGLKVKQLHFDLEFDSTEGIITAVEAGLGVGFASWWAISKELQIGSVRAIPIRGVRITRPLSAAYPRGRQPQGVALSLLEFLRARRDLMVHGRFPDKSDA